VGTIRPGPRRPLTRLAVVSTSAHVFFELGAGVGMPLASWIGPVGAAGLWASATAAGWRRAGTASPAGDAFFAAVDGLCLAAAIAHLTVWPTRRRRPGPGLPWLVECEGLGAGLMPAYNVLIYTGASLAAAALALENRGTGRRPAAAGLAAVPVLMAVQRVEYARLREQAARRPGWWNRRLGPRAAAAG
jgi:hypothetical protein